MSLEMQRRMHSVFLCDAYIGKLLALTSFNTLVTPSRGIPQLVFEVENYSTITKHNIWQEFTKGEGKADAVFMYIMNGEML